MKKTKNILDLQKNCLKSLEKEIMELKKKKSSKAVLRERENYARNVRETIFLLENGKKQLVIDQDKRFLRVMQKELKDFEKDKKEAEELIRERKIIISNIKNNIILTKKLKEVD